MMRTDEQIKTLRAYLKSLKPSSVILHITHAYPGGERTDYGIPAGFHNGDESCLKLYIDGGQSIIALKYIKRIKELQLQRVLEILHLHETAQERLQEGPIAIEFED